VQTADARKALEAAGYSLHDRPSKWFDNEIVLCWPFVGAIGVLCERAGSVHPGEVEQFVANAANTSGWRQD